MKIENRTELKEYRIECQKKQSADCRVLVCGEPDVWQVDQARFMKS